MLRPLQPRLTTTTNTTNTTLILLQAGRNAVRARTGSRRRGRMDPELEFGEV